MSSTEEYIFYSNNKKIKIDEKTLEKIYTDEKESFKQMLLSENLLVLAGAGSSVMDKEPGGKLMAGLWETIKIQLDNRESGSFDKLLSLVNHDPNEHNLETLLSKLQIEKKALENKNNDVSTIETGIVQLEKIIVDECKFFLPDDSPHSLFLNKLMKSRGKTSHRLKIFTLNYDTCFEQAADKLNAVIIDGFCFTQTSRFSSGDFDLDIIRREQARIQKEDNFFSKVFHLYKIHGSVNWQKPTPPELNIIKKDNPTEALLIYPNSSKFEYSYQMPFFELISRFQISLRIPNTTLLIIGYGFNDEHINRILEEAMRTNINMKTFIVNRSIKVSVGNPPKNLRERLARYIENGHTDIVMIADSFDNFTKNLPEVSFPDREEEREAIF